MRKPEQANGQSAGAGRMPSQLSAAAVLTSQELAAILQVHVKTVARWRRSQALPCVRLGGRIRFLGSDVLRWLSARKEE